MSVFCRVSRLCALSAVAALAIAAAPAAAAEFTFDEKVNAEMVRKMNIPVHFALPASARAPLPQNITTTDRLIDFKHPDAKGKEGDVGLRLVIAKRRGSPTVLGRAVWCRREISF
jgi:hypothetical protein